MLQRRQRKAGGRWTVGWREDRRSREDRAVGARVVGSYADATIPSPHRRIEPEKGARRWIGIGYRASGAAVQRTRAQQPLEPRDVGGAHGEGALTRASVSDIGPRRRNHSPLQLRRREEEQAVAKNR